MAMKKSEQWFQPVYYIENRRMRIFVDKNPVYLYLLMRCICFARKNDPLGGRLLDSDDLPLLTGSLAFYSGVSLEVCEDFFSEAEKFGYLILGEGSSAYRLGFWEDLGFMPGELSEEEWKKKAVSERLLRASGLESGAIRSCEDLGGSR